MKVEIAGVTIRRENGEGIQVTDEGFVDIKVNEIAPGGYIRVNGPESSAP